MSPEFVGILNITPDSFSDGGKFNILEKAIKHTKKLIHDGASIIDIGAESTRPNAIPLTHAEEWARLQPILEAIKKEQFPAKTSVDTYHPETAKLAINLGVDWINDVSGCTSPDMIDILKNSNVQIICMHNLSIPADKNITIPLSENATEVVYSWCKNKINQLVDLGINRERIIIDPGIGFGKTAEQSLELIKNIEIFHSLSVKLFVGHSRKSFLSLLGNKQNRDIKTCIVTAFLASKNVNYIRVHDIASNIATIESYRDSSKIF